MENAIFLKPAVAGVLAKGFVESRLHTDKPDEKYRLGKALQHKLTQSVANPIYVIVDPSKPEEVRARFDGSTLDPATFAEFLKKGLDQRS